MNEKESLNSNKVLFSDLPADVQRTILTSRSNSIIAAGPLRINGPNKVWYGDREVAGLPFIPEIPGMSYVETTPGGGILQVNIEKKEGSGAPTASAFDGRPFFPRRNKGEPLVPEPQGNGEIQFSDLPQEAKRYIRNYFPNTQMSLTVDGQQLVIGRERITYGGKLVILEPASDEPIVYIDLPVLVRKAIRNALKGGYGVQISENGSKIIVGYELGKPVVTFNGQQVIELPEYY